MHSPTFLGSLSSAKPSYYQNPKLTHPAGLTVVFLLHIYTELLLYSVGNFSLIVFSQQLQIPLLADLTAQSLPLNFQYIQQNTSKYAHHQKLGRNTSTCLACTK